jgi:uncharacterized protein (DUF58 family)
MALTGRAALLAALGAIIVGFVFPGWQGVLAVEIILGVLIAVDVLLAGSVRSLTLDRSGDSQVRLGQPARVQLVIHNLGNRRLRGELRDAWPPSAGGITTRHHLTVPAGERRRVVTELLPTRRGDRHSYRVTVRAVGPLGLAGRQGSHAAPWRVRVLAPFLSRRHLGGKLAQLRNITGGAQSSSRGRGTEFDALRDYVLGDDVRSIDWRATARQQSVVVRTWCPERDRQVLLVFDTGRTSAGRIGDAPRLDASLDAGLLLGAVAAKAGDRVGLLAYDRRLRSQVRSASATDVLPRLVTAMSALEPDLVETDPRGLAAAISRAAPRRSLVILFTGLDAAPIEAGLLGVLPGLARRHRLVVAAVADSRITDMATGRHSTAAIYEAAAAERVIAERRRMTVQLSRLGIVVVDATPELLPPRLTDAYLTLKATGNL